MHLDELWIAELVGRLKTGEPDEEERELIFGLMEILERHIEERNPMRHYDDEDLLRLDVEATSPTTKSRVLAIATDMRWCDMEAAVTKARDARSEADRATRAALKVRQEYGRLLSKHQPEQPQELLPLAQELDQWEEELNTLQKLEENKAARRARQMGDELIRAREARKAQKAREAEMAKAEAWAKIKASYQELAAANAAAAEAKGTSMPRCHFCGLKGVKRHYQCPNLKDHKKDGVVYHN